MVYLPGVTLEKYYQPPFLIITDRQTWYSFIF
jgi:hypothetical protein